MPENKKRLGTRNPLQLFSGSPQAIEAEQESLESLIQESGIKNQESGIQNQGSGIQNQESETINRSSEIQAQRTFTISEPLTNTHESEIQNPESGIQNQESEISSEPLTNTYKSGIQNLESRIQNQESEISSEPLTNTYESGIQNQESGIKNQESRIRNQELAITSEPLRLYSLSVRIPESLNDDLDEALKRTRRSMGRKIRKEVLVAVAIEAMFQQVEVAGGWSAIASEEELRQLLGVKI
jgi:hypothetical protein